MATSLQTANYGFGKYAPNDVTSYLTDYNGTMDKIDGAIKGVSDVANEAKATGDSNLNNIANLSQGMTATNKNVENLGKTQTAQGVEIENLKNDLSEIVIGDYLELSATALHGQTTGTLARKVGDGVQGYFGGTIKAGSYNPDRTLNNRQLIDLLALTGNPFSLTARKSIPSKAISASVGGSERKIIGFEAAMLYYDDATNYTRIALVINGSVTYDEEREYLVIF